MQTATSSNSSSSQQPQQQQAAQQQKKFTPLVQQFLDYLHLEKHFSDYTVKSYGADLIQYGQFLTGEIGHTNAEPPLNVVFPETPQSTDEKQVKAEPLQIREFLAYLYAQNYTKSTTARKLATLRSFYKFLIRKGVVQTNPLATIRTPKQEKRLPKCLDLEQVQPAAVGLESARQRDRVKAEQRVVTGCEVLQVLAEAQSKRAALEIGLQREGLEDHLQRTVEHAVRQRLRVQGTARRDRAGPHHDE
jgi:integrase